VSIGDTLAEARRQSGLTVTQVSEQTRIRESIIRSVEQDDFSPCGGDFYARGHIRSIAEVAGTDPVPLIREYDAEHGALGGMRAAQIFEPATPIKIREPRRLHLGQVLAVALLAVIGLGAYHLVAARGSKPAAASGNQRAGAAAAVRPVVRATPPATARAAGRSAVSSKNGPAKKAKKKEAVIKLTALTDCWIGLDRSSGATIYQGTVPAGQTMTWTEKNAVSLVIGNPTGIKLTVDGKTEKMNTVQVVRFNIDPKAKTPVSLG
jgi:cytoskeletal protein RodZ